jgi:hypothetical protein
MLGNIQKSTYKVSDFLGWQKSDTLVLSPKFQRRPVWSAGAKSFLIDTIIRGFPIPIIFVRERKTDLKTLQHKREVVDGQQRIRTVLSYIAPQSLKDFNKVRDEFTIKRAHSEAYADMGFSDLPEDVQRAILDYEFSVHVLPSSIGDREIIQLFARMNSTGFKLNEQELRNAQFFGAFKTSMFEIAAEQLERWRSWSILTEDQIARMLETELTSELAQLMLSGVGGKSQVAITALYQDKDANFPERSEVERRFRATMDAIQGLIGTEMPNTAFRKRAPFFALFAVVYDGLFGLGSSLRKQKSKTLPSAMKAALLEADREIALDVTPRSVNEALARRTTHPESRKAVVAYLKGKCGIV